MGMHVTGLTTETSAVKLCTIVQIWGVICASIGVVNRNMDNIRSNEICNSNGGAIQTRHRISQKMLPSMCLRPHNCLILSTIRSVAKLLCRFPAKRNVPGAHGSWHINVISFNSA